MPVQTHSPAKKIRGDSTDRRQPTVLIAVNQYSIVCLQLRASQWCTLSKVKIHLIWVMLLIDINRYSIVCLPLRASQWCTLEGEDTFDMGDSTDRHQPLQHRVSPVKSVSMVHPLEGEDTFYMAVNRYTIVCLPLREEHCTLSQQN